VADHRIVPGSGGQTSDEAINDQTANYTVQQKDGGVHIRMTNAAGRTVTIPPDSTLNFPIGARFRVSQGGAGAVTITAGAGVTLHSRGGLVATNGQYAEVVCTKTDANTWLVSGDRV
jgi:hypothetical protein